ncbi:MAG TPA: MinD/ParA family protein [Candidatus Binatia bacterium]
MSDIKSISALRRRPSTSAYSLRARGRLVPLGMAPVFAITSGKGGVGKTTVTANLATTLARKGQRVLAIDADVGLANLDLLFGVKPAYTIADFFSGRAAIDEIVTTTPQGVMILPGASGVQQLTALSGAQKLALASGLESLARQVDLVIIDTCSGISDAATYFATAAQQIVVVVTPEPASLTDAYALIKVLASTYGEKHFKILFNNIEGEDQARRLFDNLSRVAVRFLNVSLDCLGWIPRDPQFLAAVAHSRLVVEEAADAPSARAFGVVTGRLIESALAGGRMKGNLQFFFRQVLEGMEGV